MCLSCFTEGLHFYSLAYMDAGQVAEWTIRLLLER